MSQVENEVDDHQARRRAELQKWISQGLKKHAHLDFILHSDIEKSHFEEVHLVRRTILQAEREDDAEVGCLRSSGYCAGYDENHGLIRIVHVWDYKNGCPDELLGGYYLAADTILSMNITSNAS